MERPTAVLAPDLARDALLARLKALVPAFEREGGSRMWLIGSRARGDNRPDSDIDLMIEVVEGQKFSLLDLIGVKPIVEDDIGLPVDIIVREGLEKPLFERLERDAFEVS